MTILDTHILIWWMNGSDRLSSTQLKAISPPTDDSIGVSAITCWEIAKLVEKGRLDLDRPVLEWTQTALSMSKVVLIPLSPEIAVASTQLPGTFHSDPADQIIVATARETNSPLVTSDQKILEYEHVETIR